MIVIAIHGLKGSGKTTFAGMVAKCTAGKSMCTHVESFATPLKVACNAIFGCDRPENYWGSDSDKNEPTSHWGALLGEEYATYRRILQTVGTKLFRDTVHKNIWVHVMHRVLLKLEGNGVEVVIIDDCRFDNEATYLRDIGAEVVHIRNAQAKIQFDDHVSEKPILLDDHDTIMPAFTDLQHMNHEAHKFCDEVEFKNVNLTTPV